MGLPPQYLFVVRHGNRLDAADKRWHLTSPTPYDPPLTYGGFLQARQVGVQIANILEQCRMEDGAYSNDSAPVRRRKKFKVVIHSSPFLRCVQTSIAISSGLSQKLPDYQHGPSDLIVPRASSDSKHNHFKSAILRLDSFLGEWLSPEYFEMITPPPGSSLMLGAAKAGLLKKEDYSRYTIPGPTHSHASSASSLWNGASTPNSSNPSLSQFMDQGSAFTTSELSSALQEDSRRWQSYLPPRPSYAVSSAGKIPDGFVSHAKDMSMVVDYQWDSMRDPLDFGDGGTLGEEWTTMHKRFRGGMKKMVNWYWNTEEPAEPVSSGIPSESPDDLEEDDLDAETVVIIVSHGAGCNALIGAITHQPVLMDVGIASITMAARKAEIKPRTASPDNPSSTPSIHTDQIYDIRLSASTEHLHSTVSTPVSARSSSIAGIAMAGARGRTSTLGVTGGPLMGSFSFSESFAAPGSRSTSASAALGIPVRRESNPTRPARGSALSSIGFGAIAGNGDPMGGSGPSPTSTQSPGLWSPTPSSLRNMDDGGDDEERDAFGDMIPNFDQKRFRSDMFDRGLGTFDMPSAGSASPLDAEQPGTPGVEPRGPILAAPIKLQTNLDMDKPAEEVAVTQLGDGLGGLWGIPPPPEDAERYRDLTHAKRRWTVNEL